MMLSKMSLEITSICGVCDLMRACQWTTTVLNQFRRLSQD